MNIDFKMFWMVGGAILSVGVAYGTAKAGISALKEKVTRLYKVVFREHGELNFITPNQCRNSKSDCKEAVCEKIDKLTNQVENYREEVLDFIINKKGE